MTNAVTTRQEPDYRVIYLRETDFMQRMNDVYLSKQTRKGAPFLDEILEELLDIEAILFADKAEEDPEAYGFTADELDGLKRRVIEFADINAIHDILVRFDRYFFEMFEDDVVKFLMEYRMCFHVRATNYHARRDSIIYNIPVASVW